MYQPHIPLIVSLKYIDSSDFKLHSCSGSTSVLDISNRNQLTIDDLIHSKPYQDFSNISGKSNHHFSRLVHKQTPRSFFTRLFCLIGDISTFMTHTSQEDVFRLYNTVNGQFVRDKSLIAYRRIEIYICVCLNQTRWRKYWTFSNMKTGNLYPAPLCLKKLTFLMGDLSCIQKCRWY